MYRACEQVEADLMRTLYRFNVITSEVELCRLINELQIKLFEKGGITPRSTVTLTDTATP